MVDKSIKYPRGTVEDALKRGVIFESPIDFILLDIEHDVEIPFSVGDSFLDSSKSTLYVQPIPLVFKVNIEHGVFDTFASLQSPFMHYYSISVDAIDPCWQVHFPLHGIHIPIRLCQDELDHNYSVKASLMRLALSLELLQNSRKRFSCYIVLLLPPSHPHLIRRTQWKYETFGRPPD
jgi:hypothetical protein